MAARGAPLLLLAKVTLKGEDGAIDEDEARCGCVGAGAGGGGCLARVEVLLERGITSSSASSSIYSSSSDSPSKGDDVEVSTLDPRDADALVGRELGAEEGGVTLRRLTVDLCRIGRPEGERYGASSTASAAVATCRPSRGEDSAGTVAS